MAYQLRKEMYNTPYDFPVRSELNDMVCKIAKIKKGFYIYNKLGEEVAQVTFEKNVARMAIAHVHGSVPTVSTMMIGERNQFAFIRNVYEKADRPFVEKLRGELPNRFSVWGTPDAYTFDVYDGSELAGRFVPNPRDAGSYLMEVGPKANALQMIMIAIAAEKLNADPLSKT